MPRRFNSNLMKRRTQSGLEVIPEKEDILNRPITSFDANDLGPEICKNLKSLLLTNERGMSDGDVLNERYLNDVVRKIITNLIEMPSEQRKWTINYLNLDASSRQGKIDVERQVSKGEKKKKTHKKKKKKTHKKKHSTKSKRH